MNAEEAEQWPPPPAFHDRPRDRPLGDAPSASGRCSAAARGSRPTSATSRAPTSRRRRDLRRVADDAARADEDLLGALRPPPRRDVPDLQGVGSGDGAAAARRDLSAVGDGRWMRVRTGSRKMWIMSDQSLVERDSQLVRGLITRDGLLLVVVLGLGLLAGGIAWRGSRFLEDFAAEAVGLVLSIPVAVTVVEALLNRREAERRDRCVEGIRLKATTAGCPGADAGRAGEPDKRWTG